MRDHDAHGRAGRVGAALAEQLGVDATVVADAAAARVAVADLPSPVVCVAPHRHGLRAAADIPATLLLVGPHCDASRVRFEGDLLVCLDGSTRAEAALPAAASLADELDLDLWLLSAIAPPEASAMARQPGDLLQSGYLSRAVASLGGPAAVTGWDVLHGHTVPALLDHARHCRAALVALNSHGASTAARAPFGRVPARLVLDSPVPVLLTRTRAFPPVVRTAPPTRSASPRLRVVPRPPPDGDRLAVAARSYLSTTTGRSQAVRLPSVWTRQRVVAAALAVAVVFGTFAFRAPLPYHRFGGTTRPATALVSVRGAHVDATPGAFLVTIVTAEPVTLAGAVGAWLSRVHDVQRDPDHASAVSAEWANRQLMALAGETATTVALRHLGVAPGDVRVAVTPHGLGGPSAGLAMALELVDLLSPGDLTAGRVIAVSGALGPDGRVGAVGGIRYKTTAARRAGADVLLVPPEVAPEARRYAGSMLVISVASFTDALAALESL
jgi:PDZ domain-containing protein